MDFINITSINEYFYLKPDNNTLTCRITDINDEEIHFEMTGYYHSFGKKILLGGLN